MYTTISDVLLSFLRPAGWLLPMVCDERMKASLDDIHAALAAALQVGQEHLHIHYHGVVYAETLS